MSHYIGLRRRNRSSVAIACFPVPSPMQTEFFSCRPRAPVVVWHRDIRRTEECKGIIHRVRETRHAADIRALTNPFGTNRMVRGWCRGPVGLPFRGLDGSREEIVHQRRGGHVAVLVVV